MASSKFSGLRSKSLPNSLHSQDLESGRLEPTAAPHSTHSEDLVSLDNVIVDDFSCRSEPDVASDGTFPESVSLCNHSSSPEFRPGYHEGLLVVLERLAKLLTQEPVGDAWDLPFDRTAEDVDWAREVLDAIHNRGNSIPELPTGISDPFMASLVHMVNKRCSWRCVSQFVGQDMKEWSQFKPSVWKHLPSWEVLRKASRIPMVMDMPLQPDSADLKKLLTETFPIPATLRISICDLLEDGHCNRFETTLGSVMHCE